MSTPTPPSPKVLVGFDTSVSHRRYGKVIASLMKGMVMFVPDTGGNPRVAVRQALRRQGYVLHTRSTVEDGVPGWAMWRGEAVER
jgi:hypothetical protein